MRLGIVATLGGILTWACSEPSDSRPGGAEAGGGGEAPVMTEGGSTPGGSGAREEGGAAPTMAGAGGVGEEPGGCVTRSLAEWCETKPCPEDLDDFADTFCGAQSYYQSDTLEDVDKQLTSCQTTVIGVNYGWAAELMYFDADGKLVAVEYGNDMSTCGVGP